MFKKKNKTEAVSKKEKKPKKKFTKVEIAAVITSGIIVIGIICLIAGIIVMMSMLQDKPEVHIDDFQNPESSIVYDKNGDVIAELGLTIRENVTYEELPTSLIDAFVSVEDSRYFTHNGFDIARFTKALLENLKSFSFSQGGSTFTMQLVKNTYFVDDEAGINAPKKIGRKVQEIVMAMELENQTSKKNIMELYLNKLNFGGNRNIRGVQKAAEYYFDKDVTELNLAESALLAGVINAPYAYNPFLHLEAATARRDNVLYLMNYHGYITDLEYEMATAIKVEDLLVDPNNRDGKGDAVNYQAYVDAVVSEVYDLTNQDPYITPMKIYTYMDPEVQSLMDHIQAWEGVQYDEEGNEIEQDYTFNFTFPDEEFEIASISINNETGAINGILGGRNYADGGELLLNHAIDQYKQPGSSIKPILEYALAFEKLGWATSHVLVDKPIVYAGTNHIIYNSNKEFAGEVTLKDAVGNSLNTTAIQTLEEVLSATSYQFVVDYLNSIGFHQVTMDNFNVQFAIGGSELTVTTLQMAAAQAALINGGQYIQPHTISKIEFMNGKTPITPTYTPTQVLSEQAAYLTTELLYNNVYGDYANMMQILRTNYPIYAKTGTTDWGTSGRPYNIPDGSIKDAWNLASTSEFTVCTWVGYEKASVDKQSYITWNAYTSNIQGKVNKQVLDLLATNYGKPAAVERPDGISSITHILATYPYAAPIEGMDEQYITTGLIATQNAKLVNPEEVTIEKMSDNLKTSYDPLTSKLKIEFPEYPDVEKTKPINDEMDISLKRADGSVILEEYGKKLFDYSWVFGQIRYKADIKVNDKTVEHISTDNTDAEKTISIVPGDLIEVCAFYGYEKKDLNSNKVCKKIQTEDKEVVIEFPGDSSVGVDEELAAIQNWAKSKGIALDIIKTEVDNPSVVGTFNFSDVNRNYNPGDQVTMKQSEIMKWSLVCNYNVQKKLVISSSITGNEVKANDAINFTSNLSNTTWSVSGSASIDSNSGALIVSANAAADSEIVVTASAAGQTASMTFKVVASQSE